MALLQKQCTPCCKQLAFVMINWVEWFEPEWKCMVYTLLQSYNAFWAVGRQAGVKVCIKTFLDTLWQKILGFFKRKKWWKFQDIVNQEKAHSKKNIGKLVLEMFQQFFAFFKPQISNWFFCTFLFYYLPFGLQTKTPEFKCFCWQANSLNNKHGVTEFH